jgi:hypothetical protein
MLTLQFHLQYMPILYTDVFLQIVVGDVLSKHNDVGIFSVLYIRPFNNLLYKLISL